MKNLIWFLAGLLVLIAVGISALVVYISTTRPLTAVEGILWQVFALTAGLAGSFIFGQQSAREAAKEMIKPHARSAFRRLVSLYLSLSRAATAIKSEPESDIDKDPQMIIVKLDVIITEQLDTAEDALEDWHNIVPEDVEKLKQKLQSNNTKEDEQ